MRKFFFFKYLNFSAKILSFSDLIWIFAHKIFCLFLTRNFQIFEFYYENIFTLSIFAPKYISPVLKCTVYLNFRAKIFWEHISISSLQIFWFPLVKMRLFHIFHPLCLILILFRRRSVKLVRWLKSLTNTSSMALAIHSLGIWHATITPRQPCPKKLAWNPLTLLPKMECLANFTTLFHFHVNENSTNFHMIYFNVFLAKSLQD